MKCAWKELLSILPQWMRKDVDLVGKEDLQELRLRLSHPPELICGRDSFRLSTKVRREDIQFVVNTASRYSPWVAETLSDGYVTAPGGHRIGICGEAVMKAGRMTSIRNPSSLCIRVARDILGVFQEPALLQGSVLVIGPPGSGKTTLLRDLIRQRSETGNGSVAVVDERCEIFPVAADFFTGSGTDVLSGCIKTEGIEILLRTMGPKTIAVDEITSEKDCEALIRAAWCGVSLLATAHASSCKDLKEREVYRPLINRNIFDTLVTLREDKSWRIERMVHE